MEVGLVVCSYHNSEAIHVFFHPITGSS
jgi:hypothetical protein